MTYSKFLTKKELKKNRGCRTSSSVVGRAEDLGRVPSLEGRAEEGTRTNASTWEEHVL